MEYMISAKTDIGTVRKTNQDCVIVKTAISSAGKVVLAAICDGMGGLDEGSYASTTVTKLIEQWFQQRLSAWLEDGCSDMAFRKEWTELMSLANRELIQYGSERELRVGTTCTTLLLLPRRYYISHVGDTRVYEISDTVVRLTHDHTVAARDARNGLISMEEAEYSENNRILTQCVGVSGDANPEFYFGTTRTDTVYLLCSDGFRHKLKPKELLDAFSPLQASCSAAMGEACDSLIELVKQRGEADNISIAVIRPFVTRNDVKADPFLMENDTETDTIQLD